MAIASFYNDGAIPYGSRPETFSRGGVSLGAYVLENLSINRPGKIIKRYDELGGPNGSVGVPDFVNGSATAQEATSSAKPLRPGDQFTDTFDGDLGAETWFITDTDQPEGQNEYKKYHIKFIKKYN